MDDRTLDLHLLGGKIPGLTDSLGQMHAEAAAVCLEHNEHAQGVSLLVKGDSQIFPLSWPKVTHQMLRAYADLQDATEMGACGIAILLIMEMTDLTVVERSWKGTGFDYWLGRSDEHDGLPFQNRARLEVSGLLDGSDSRLTSRVRQKLEQTKISDSTRLPAFVIVVDFGPPKAQLEER
ncbi:hypothetical protein Mal52_07260 [Symmachiella dynata]|uniref:Uncharacterized protein n=1 Tax=Symmachiella dynata TaxID=2527995 RepID=A0A517ZIG7_9PLAN|nr:hypothetical protein [Symmachiella dynata]QDU42270.1 hypothetical protein Mal52_07260 [Symmachiella dynata]